MWKNNTLQPFLYNNAIPTDPVQDHIRKDY